MPMNRTDKSFDSQGHISEIFEGDSPHRPVGCVGQEWSVAEILRATAEDVFGIRPKDAALSRNTMLCQAAKEAIGQTAAK
jgi:glycogen debranching enzyme